MYFSTQYCALCVHRSAGFGLSGCYLYTSLQRITLGKSDIADRNTNRNQQQLCDHGTHKFQHKQQRHDRTGGHIERNIFGHVSIESRKIHIFIVA